ncbi:MAG: transposase [Anaerolineales bacterium]|jgi:REP element-mobilizing transposase RayT
MTVPVLIVTSTPGLGEVVRRTLVESGRYEVVLSNSAVQGIRQARSVPFELAILDVDVENGESGVSLLKLGLTLRALVPQIHLVVLAATSDPYDPDIRPLAPEGIITTPLYPSNILRTVDRVAGMHDRAASPKAPAPAPAPEPVVEEPALEQTHTGLPAWLQDVTRAAQHLTRLSLETAAQAALIVSQGRLWAYAGELPQPAAQELAETVADCWDRNGESDLARFVHLDSDDGEYMLYATALGGNMVLALVFGVETPFSKIRSQAGHLARLLASAPVVDNGNAPLKEDAGLTENGNAGKMAAEPLDTLDYEPLVKDVPPPTPDQWLEEPLPSPPPPVREEDWISEYPDLTAGSPLYASIEDDIHSPYPSSKPNRGAEAVHGLDDTSPLHPRQAVAQISKVSMMDSWELKPVSSGIYSLTYGLLLLPRLPGHHLVGDLAERLPVWVSQLCIAFAWRLEHISVRPDYLQWNASASPDTAPGRMVRDLRKHTSQRIFEEFPRFGRENPSGDFWAPGFLLISGPQPPPAELVRDFIQQTRRNQGLLRPGSKQTR